MGTSKRKLQIYIDMEFDVELELLYQLYELRSRRRGLSMSMSKFIEGILKDYVKKEKELLISKSAKRVD